MARRFQFNKRAVSHSGTNRTRKKRRSKWTISKVHVELESICEELGYFPSYVDLKGLDRYDILYAIYYLRYPWAYWQSLSKYEPKDSPVKKGNRAELLLQSYLEEMGYEVRHTTFKCPYDLLVNGCFRIEVKVREYNPSAYGWTIVFRNAGGVRTDAMDVAVIFCVNKDRDFINAYITPPKWTEHETITVTGSKKWKDVENQWHDLLDQIDSKSLLSDPQYQPPPRTLPSQEHFLAILSTGVS